MPLSPFMHMRPQRLRLLLSAMIACQGLGVALAQQKGDRIVAITDTVLRSQDGASTKIDKGKRLTVKYVSHDRLYATWIGAPGTIDGWINRSAVIPFSQSLDFFGKELKRSPTARTYAIRATIWDEKHDYDKAIADWSEAIRLEPNQPSAYVERGSVFFDKKEYDKAIADYTEVIRLNPKSGVAYGNRGSAWWAKEEYSRATYDYIEAIRFDPENAFDYIHRGELWTNNAEHNKALWNYKLETMGMKPTLAIIDVIHNPRVFPKDEFDETIAKCNEEIRRHPKNAKSYLVRARFFHDQTEYEQAIADYDEAIRLDPQKAEPWVSEALIAATGLKTRFRDGKKAVHHATKACELTSWSEYTCLDALAAACAEVGDFPNAVKWEKRAIDALPQEKDPELRVLFEAKLRSHLDLFNAKKPYHEEARK
jgi:tetratricopeptide (TPR) repeat protein